MIQKPKGTKDLFGKDSKNWLYIENIIKNICEKYNYSYIKTPIFEKSELFHRGVGDTTDIVQKETYDFIDRGKRNMTLKPEGTAGAARLYIENKLYANPINPSKLYYIGPCFRYERPQSGRLREHTQFGVEVFGLNNPIIDAEVISMPILLFKMLGLKSLKVKINSLGDIESRNNYKKALIKHIKPEINNLCSDCQKRLEKNPLRILDCKVDSEKEIIKTAPLIKDYYNEESKNYLNEVLNYLDELEIEYEVDHKLVRGLDYYSHTVFEIQAEVEGFGAKTTICAGGRYNELVETLDGPKTPGIGFGMGLERLLLILEAENIDFSKENGIDVYIYSFENTNKKKILKLANYLRNNGFKTEIEYFNKKLKTSFKNADRLNSKYIIIADENLESKASVNIKNNNTKEQIEIKIENLIEYLDKELENYEN